MNASTIVNEIKEYLWKCEDYGANSVIGSVDLVLDSPTNKPAVFYILGKDGEYYRVDVARVDDVNVV